MSKIKAIVLITETKPDVYGGTYRTATITNPKNGKSFTTHAVGEGNIRCILWGAFGHDVKFMVNYSYTNSTRLSSLPESISLNDSSFDEGWKKALNGIGYKCNAIK